MVLDVVADAKKIADFWDGQVKKLATDVKWEEVTKATLNRMEAYGRKGCRGPRSLRLASRRSPSGRVASAAGLVKALRASSAALRPSG